jgi:EAL domain-containing protein (putative c-di-GMP-specific phosphodiesterase class I)
MHARHGVPVATSRVEVGIGEIIFREGDPPTTAFLIEHGQVEVYTVQGEAAVVLGRLGPGDLLGEMAVIDASTRTATARATSACVLTPIGRDQLQERLEAADPIVRALLRGQLARYRAALATLRGEADDGERGARGVDAADNLDASAIDKIRLESQLREALSRRGLEVRFQPILEIADDRISGYEALIRWQHPDRGAISPVEFIALAEETSLIVPVGRYVFEEVCRALALLRDADVAPLPFVSVNVSARQLEEEGLLDEVRTIAASTGVPLDVIKVEVTESLTLDIDKVAALIARCHLLGMKVALDDFGTGYSNLGHLHQLHFDTVKLDQGFTRQMLAEPRVRAIVEAIVHMVGALGADLIAEGVETAEQLAALRAMGCRYAQGYLVGRPQGVDEMLAAQRAA